MAVVFKALCLWTSCGCIIFGFMPVDQLWLYYLWLFACGPAVAVVRSLKCEVDSVHSPEWDSLNGEVGWLSCHVRLRFETILQAWFIAFSQTFEMIVLTIWWESRKREVDLCNVLLSEIPGYISFQWWGWLSFQTRMESVYESVPKREVDDCITI